MRREWLAVLGLVAVACVGPGPIALGESEGEGEGEGEGIEASDEAESSSTSTTDATTTDPDNSSGFWCEFPGEPTDPLAAIDLLIVVDNGPSMADEQAKLVAAIPALFDGLLALEDPFGDPLWPSLNIMVTSTDMGHPLCTDDQAPGYVPKQGAPEQVPCIDRLDDFTSVGPDPIAVPELCTSACPLPSAPVDPFVHVSGAYAGTTNVAGNKTVEALQCLVPQGISGCAYGSPLEAMLRALDPEAEWNLGARPFARPGAALIVVIVSDGYDCSVDAPSGHAYFTDPSLDDYWQLDPETNSKTRATEAVCWNAGVVCDGPDADGIYADCTASDGEVLHPLDRYTELLQFQELERSRPVFMLDLLGLPAVTAHAEQLPHQALSGGLLELDYRDWREGSYPQGDLLPGDPSSAADKQFELGIGPGCTSEPAPGVFTGQALPPVRMRELCESLEAHGDPRCCVESVCDADYQAALTCMLGAVQFAMLE